jgi:hypothetical protein
MATADRARGGVTGDFCFLNASRERVGGWNDGTTNDGTMDGWCHKDAERRARDGRRA